MELTITTKWSNDKNAFVSSCYHSEANVTENIEYVRYKFRDRPIINDVEYFVSHVTYLVGREEVYTLMAYEDWIEKNTIRRKG